MTETSPVVVVTGGGAGIGAAVAEELGRQGWFVVTVDPLVTLDGSESLPAAEDTTAGRIIAAGGSAQASDLSVTDADGLRTLFAELMEERGRLDAVINVAGISRPTGFAKGTEADWLGVLSVHLDGYRNVLAAALPIMAAAGTGRILGVTSGSGWRAADAGAYACAKRAVAALTWEAGRHAPPGVVVNAMSPIAVTRMVTAALGRTPARGASGGNAATGGLSLGSMPQPEDLGPLAAHLVDKGFGWCSGAVVFAGGTEVAIVDPPRLLEAVRTDGVASVTHAIDAVATGAWITAEAAQASPGGSNPRFPDIAGATEGDLPAPAIASCTVVSDRPEELAEAILAALAGRGISVTATPVASGFEATAAALADAGEVDALVVALSGPPAATEGDAWQRILAEHDDLVGRIHGDAAWVRATADRSAATGRPLRVVTVTDAATAGGRSRAQAAAQLARASRRATDDRVAAFAVADEAGDPDTLGALIAHLVTGPGTEALAGAELVVGPGWAGLRSHPRPTGSIVLGRPEIPAWLDAALGDALGAPPRGGPVTDPVRPSRIVDAHVHLWDPARTDWYPYLSGQQDIGMETKGMARRFDLPTYRAEAAGWNVVQLVNVAAATGRHSIDETLELDARGAADGLPGAVVGGLPPSNSAAEAIELIDLQMSAPRFRGVRPMGANAGPLPAPEVLRALQERGLLFEVMAHPHQLPEVAAGLEAHPELVVVIEHTGWPRADTEEERALWHEGMRALAGLGDQVLCKLSGLAMPLGAMTADAFRPWVEPALELFGVDRCLFASNFPVDGMHGTLDQLWSAYAALTAGVDDGDRDRLFAANAERIYLA